ncbi:MAG: hypothetical protein ACI4BC_09185 [Muribaculaceae bacterium]
MRRIRIISLAIALVMSLTTPISITSQNHRGYRPSSGNSSNTENNRGGNNNRPSNGNNNRPSNGNNNRPGNDRPNNGGNNRPGNDRPNNGNNHGGNNGGYRPGPNHGTPPPPPNHGHSGYRPYHSGHYCPPPSRPYRPAYRPIVRPHVPHGYVYYSGAPVIDNILGLVFGMAYNASLDYLYRNGYNVDGYNNGRVYLRGVSELGYYWDDGFLSYDGYGRLNVIQFSMSDYYNDTRRFNDLYNTLCRRYGPPVYYSDNYNNRECSWFGAGGRGYVTLQFTYNYVNGYQRYYTTLTYNN